MIPAQLHLPDWLDESRFNQAQRPILEEVLGHFEDGKRLVLVDAPCGSGKTILAYATYLSFFSNLYYLVGTKNLQEQLKRDFPSASLIQGRANYLPLNVPTRTWAGPNCSDCDREESDCSLCYDVFSCPYTVAKELAEANPFTIANYSYALGEWLSPKSKFRGRDLVVCDEADTLVDELLGHISVSISPRLQKTLRIEPPAKKTVESAWPPWFDYAIPFIEKYRDKLHGSSLETKRLKSTLNNLLGGLRMIQKEPDGWVYDYPNGAIEFKPVTVDKFGPDYIWDRGRHFLAMSGSLGSPEQFVNDLGYDNSWAFVSAPSTFAKERRPLYYIPCAKMYHKGEEKEWPKMAQAVKLIRTDLYPDKRILVHTQSKALTRFIYNHLEDVDMPVFAYFDSDSRKGIIEEFENTDGAMLLAMSLARGYDNRDIDVNVICKVPFPFLGSKQVSARRYATRDGEQWYANETSVKLVQQYGRGMRAETDSGITLLLDEVFATFYARWKKQRDGSDGSGRRHRLFPEHVVEAIQWNSDVRFRLRSLVREQIVANKQPAR